MLREIQQSSDSVPGKFPIFDFERGEFIRKIIYRCLFKERENANLQFNIFIAKGVIWLLVKDILNFHTGKL